MMAVGEALLYGTYVTAHDPLLAQLRRISLPRTSVNRGRRALSEVAELAGVDPLQYQLEEPRPDASAALERVPQGTDGEQNEPYHRRQGYHHKPVSPRALQPEQVREAHRRYPPEDQHGPQDPGHALL